MWELHDVIGLCSCTFLVGFFTAGSFFYNYGKKMALDLHSIHTRSMTCEEAIRYEQIKAARYRDIDY